MQLLSSGLSNLSLKLYCTAICTFLGGIPLLIPYPLVLHLRIHFQLCYSCVRQNRRNFLIYLCMVLQEFYMLKNVYKQNTRSTPFIYQQPLDSPATYILRNHNWILVEAIHPYYISVALSQWSTFPSFYVQYYCVTEPIVVYCGV